MTIPRLELPACLLLSKLMQRVGALKLKIDDVKLRSDSSIALALINTSPHLLKTFVSNRVSQIQQLTSNYQWGHVSSKMNPADIISRGSDATTLGSNKLWWKGPDFLNKHNFQDKNGLSHELYSSELKPVTTSFLTLKLIHFLMTA
ncbi:hypothetical protein X975_00932, partial [Stegodyphus mimosarum]